VSRIFVLQLDFLNFHERDGDFLGSRTLADFDVQIVGGDARDPAGNVLAARGFEDKHHVLVRIAPDEAEEAGELRLKESPVEGELATLENLGLWQRRCRRRRRCRWVSLSTFGCRRRIGRGPWFRWSGCVRLPRLPFLRTGYPGWQKEENDGPDEGRHGPGQIAGRHHERHGAAEDRLTAVPELEKSR
jgi:hypothetical protein